MTAAGCVLAWIAGALLHSVPTVAQSVDFQIVWINVGEVAAGVREGGARAGRQLFMAPDLVDFSLKNITVAEVQVEPAIIPLKIGQRFCLTSLQVSVNSENRSKIDNAPLSVSVRQDQRERLALERGARDLCVAPTTAGEYPVRFNSLLPARDGTTRGAQIFLRVQAENVEAIPTQPSALSRRSASAEPS